MKNPIAYVDSIRKSMNLTDREIIERQHTKIKAIFEQMEGVHKNIERMEKCAARGQGIDVERLQRRKDEIFKRAISIERRRAIIDYVNTLI